MEQDSCNNLPLRKFSNPIPSVDGSLSLYPMGSNQERRDYEQDEVSAPLILNLTVYLHRKIMAFQATTEYIKMGRRENANDHISTAKLKKNSYNNVEDGNTSVFHGIDTKQAKEEISHVQLDEKLFLSQSNKLLCFESFHNRTGTVSQTMHILRDDITEKQQQSTLYKLADPPNMKRMPSTLSIATARPLAQLTADTRQCMPESPGIKEGSDPNNYFTTRVPSCLGDNFPVCLTNVVHGVYGVQYKFCEIRVNFVKLKIQDGDRIEINYVPGLKGGSS